MEKVQTLTIIITFLTSLSASLLGSSVLTAYLNRRWTKLNRNTDIFEEQYLKVVSPIYRELKSKNNDKEKIITNIDTIIYDNFHLLPEQLLEKYNNITTAEDEFEKLVSDFYALFRSELGYSKIKISKDIKEKEKLLAYKNIMTIIDSIVINFLEFFGIVITIFSAYGLHLISTSNPENKNYLTVYIIFLIMGICIVVLPIIYFIKTNYFDSKNTSRKRK